MLGCLLGYKQCQPHALINYYCYIDSMVNTHPYTCQFSKTLRDYAIMSTLCSVSIIIITPLSIIVQYITPHRTHL